MSPETAKHWVWPVTVSMLLLIWLAFLFFQRNRPEEAGLAPVQSTASATVVEDQGAAVAASGAGPDTWAVYGEVLRNRMVLLLGGVYFCLKPARYLFLFWGPMYVHEKLGTDAVKSTLIGSAFELGGPLGALLAGWISDRVFGARRIPVGAISLLGLSVLLYFFDDLPASAAAIGAVLFLMGALTYAADSLLAGTAALDFGSARGASTASGVVNGAGSIGQIIGPAIPGILPKEWGWHGVFTILAGMVLVAGLALLPKWNAMPAEAQTLAR